MVSKWWGVGLIVVLGVVWFVLAEMPARTPGAATANAATAQAPVQPAPVQQAPAAASAPAPAAPQSLKHDVTQAPQGNAAQPAPAAAGGSAPPAQLVAETPPPAASAPPAPSPAASVAPGGGASDVIGKAHAQRLAGDAAGAEATLRQAMQKAGSAAEAARTGLFLAPLAKDVKERRQLLSAALLENVVVGAEYEDVSQQLAEINRSPGASLQPLLKLETYTVVSGDSLWKLCNKGFPAKFGVTPEIGLVRLVNGMEKDTLRVGQKLVVPRNTLSIRVDTQQHGLALFLDETAVVAYRVGLGKENRTPHGNFVIRDKQEKPAWFNNGRTIPYGDPENVLGTRWMGFDDRPGATGFGIHGTADPDSIGRNESLGCVRMRNEQVEALFDLVPRGTPVVIE